MMRNPLKNNPLNLLKKSNICHLLHESILPSNTWKLSLKPHAIVVVASQSSCAKPIDEA
jgi:hypothetical protein